MTPKPLLFSSLCVFSLSIKFFAPCALCLQNLLNANHDTDKFHCYFSLFPWMMLWILYCPNRTWNSQQWSVQICCKTWTLTLLFNLVSQLFHNICVVLLSFYQVSSRSGHLTWRLQYVDTVPNCNYRIRGVYFLELSTGLCEIPVPGEGSMLCGITWWVDMKFGCLSAKFIMDRRAALRIC